MLCAIYIEAERRSQAHCANDRMVRRTVFVWHYSLTGEILIDKNVIRGAMGAIEKYVMLRVGSSKRI